MLDGSCASCTGAILLVWERTAFSPDKSLLEKVSTSVVIVNLTGYSSCNKDGSR